MRLWSDWRCRFPGSTLRAAELRDLSAMLDTVCGSCTLFSPLQSAAGVVVTQPAEFLVDVRRKEEIAGQDNLECRDFTTLRIRSAVSRLSNVLSCIVTSL